LVDALAVADCTPVADAIAEMSALPLALFFNGRVQ